MEAGRSVCGDPRVVVGWTMASGTVTVCLVHMVIGFVVYDGDGFRRRIDHGWKTGWMPEVAGGLDRRVRGA